MSKVPDAWDDDWSTAVDKPSASAAPAPKPLSRSERKTLHQEANKKLWESAENPDRPYFLEAKNELPLKTDFKPQVKVLSRKPTQQTKDVAGGLAGLSLQDEEDSEEEERRRIAESTAERQKKAAAEREEKARKYAEARERIMGPSSYVHPAEGLKSAGSSRQSSRRGRTATGRGSHPGSPADRSPARNAQSTKQRFDPSYTAKPQGTAPARISTPKEEHPIRMPRGPDASGKAGFASRGGRGG